MSDDPFLALDRFTRTVCAAEVADFCWTYPEPVPFPLLTNIRREKHLAQWNELAKTAVGCAKQLGIPLSDLEQRLRAFGAAVVGAMNNMAGPWYGCEQAGGWERAIAGGRELWKRIRSCADASSNVGILLSYHAPDAFPRSTDAGRMPPTWEELLERVGDKLAQITPTTPTAEKEQYAPTPSRPTGEEPAAAMATAPAADRRHSEGADQSGLERVESMNVGEFLSFLQAGRTPGEFAHVPGVLTLCDLAQALYGDNLNVDSLRRLRLAGALCLGKYGDGEDHNGIDSVSVEDLAVRIAADPTTCGLERPPVSAIENARRIVRQAVATSTTPTPADLEAIFRQAASEVAAEKAKRQQLDEAARKTESIHWLLNQLCLPSTFRPKIELTTDRLADLLVRFFQALRDAEIPADLSNLTPGNSGELLALEVLQQAKAGNAVEIASVLERVEKEAPTNRPFLVCALQDALYRLCGAVGPTFNCWADAAKEPGTATDCSEQGPATPTTPPAGPRRAEVADQSETDEPLEDREQQALQALLLLKAISRRNRRKLSAIAAKADPDAADSTFKRPLAKLAERGLVETQRGRDGGSWLTATGVELAKELGTTKKV